MTDVRSDSFNRSMVELKVDKPELVFLKNYGFNRSMVELKACASSINK